MSAQVSHPLVDEDAAVAQRIEWAKTMRQRFSPKDLCTESGEINQDYFKPKKIIIQLTENKKWGEPEREALFKGLEVHGVGKWRDIIESQPELQRYDDQFIRIKASRLLGTQSLARHMGWRGDRAAALAEHAKHRAIGEQTGCWKGGVLVEDDNGSVAKALAEWDAAATAAAGEATDAEASGDAA